jgi:hypothetical protein
VATQSIAHQAHMRARTCACWCLTDELLPDVKLPQDTDSGLPHLCWSTMRTTVANYVRGALDTWQESIARSVPGVADATQAELGAIGYAPLNMKYPYLLAGRPLGLVIRQWALEDRNARLATLLASDPWWNGLVEIAHDNEIDDQALAMQLARYGLPVSPAVVEHLRARAQGSNTPLPACGLLITTRVYLSWQAGRRIYVMDGHPDFIVSGELAWVEKSPSYDRAYVILEKHRKWLADCTQHNLTTLSAKRRAQPGSFFNGASTGPED